MRLVFGFEFFFEFCRGRIISSGWWMFIALKGDFERSSDLSSILFDSCSMISFFFFFRSFSFHFSNVWNRIDIHCSEYSSIHSIKVYFKFHEILKKKKKRFADNNTIFRILIVLIIIFISRCIIALYISWCFEDTKGVSIPFIYSIIFRFKYSFCCILGERYPREA